jgi:hypothetical protein
MLPNPFSRNQNRTSSVKKVAQILMQFSEQLIKVNASPSRVAKFILVQHTKTRKNIPNDHKIHQMITKYTK